ncbi:MAG: polyprenyl synthetase family protein [Clostridia bacterium]|nr:polyprenyl synthetase family protein [Clostridia bacterium]
MSSMEFSLQYRKYLDDINHEITKLSAVPDVLQKSVFSAMEYGLQGGGKRIRPVLTLAVCEMLGGCYQDALRVACAIECIHNYSLIHDDLPCMDDDAMRRGRPTCHMVFPENIALLAGDGLLNLAFELLSDKSGYTTLSAESILTLICCISRASGAWGMIGGQVIDLESEGRSDVTKERLLALHGRKTGDLIRVSAECGCICAGISDPNSEEYAKIVTFSSKLGLAFQIKDDILDVIGEESRLGKPVGSDQSCEKNTFVTLMGLEGAKEELARLTQEAKDALCGFEKPNFLLALADYLLHRDY